MDSDEMSRQLGRIEGKLDALVASMTAQVTQHKELEVRVRGLEAWKARAIGTVSVVATIGAAALTLVVKKVGGLLS